jgi:ABC-type antimicrobial peptide transport system permease subunit
MFEYEILLSVLFGVFLGFLFLWIMAGVLAQITYFQWSHIIEDKELRVQPPTSYFMLRGMIVLYKLLQNPKVELN